MKTKVIKIGNSKGVRLSKFVLEEAKIGDEVDLKIRGGKIILSPIKKEKKEKVAALTDFNDEYLLSLPAFARDWDRPEEDAAWAYLQ